MFFNFLYINLVASSKTNDAFFMNNKQREILKNAVSLMEQAKNLIEQVATGEREKFDNLSDGLQQTERGQNLDSNADALQSVADNLFDMTDEIDNIINL